MVGRKVLLRVEKQKARPGRTVLEVEHLDVVDRRGVRRVKDVSLTVRAGEILGIAGVSGNGQSELLAALTGMHAPTRGAMRLNGEDILAGGYKDAREMRRLGVAHVPEDRSHEGLVTTFDASENVILGYHDDPEYNRGLILDRRKVLETCARFMNDFDVRPPNPLLKAANFSRRQPAEDHRGARNGARPPTCWSSGSRPAASTSAPSNSSTAA